MQCSHGACVNPVRVASAGVAYVIRMKKTAIQKVLQCFLNTPMMMLVAPTTTSIGTIGPIR